MNDHHLFCSCSDCVAAWNEEDSSDTVCADSNDCDAENEHELDRIHGLDGWE